MCTVAVMILCDNCENNTTNYTLLVEILEHFQADVQMSEN